VTTQNNKTKNTPIFFTICYPICIIKNEDRLEYYNSLNEAQANNNYNEIIKFVEENLEKTFEFYFEHISNNWQEEFEMFCKGGNI